MGDGNPGRKDAVVTIPDFKADVIDEVSTILSTAFRVSVTETVSVPHSDDQAITFPNLDEKYQGVKVIETTVLYVDMRRSTQLSLKHKPHVVANLYSAFVRAMTRCANVFGGEVRGIIGDRVMMLFDQADCFGNAVDTAVLINSVCQHVLNKHFSHDDVSFGIGIDYGRMLAAKTGVRRHGSAQQSYRSLVWLGRPANVASKLTDQANKPREAMNLTKVRVAYDYTGYGLLTYEDEWPSDFVQKFTHDPERGLMVPKNQAFRSYTIVTESVVLKEATPPILMSKEVLDGYRAARPLAQEILGGWYKQISRVIPDVPGEVYGGDVIYRTFGN
jgi:class 3 adenylate cyclase